MEFGQFRRQSRQNNATVVKSILPTIFSSLLLPLHSRNSWRHRQGFPFTFNLNSKMIYSPHISVTQSAHGCCIQNQDKTCLRLWHTRSSFMSAKLFSINRIFAHEINCPKWSIAKYNFLGFSLSKVFLYQWIDYWETTRGKEKSTRKRRGKKYEINAHLCLFHISCSKITINTKQIRSKVPKNQWTFIALMQKKRNRINKNHYN